MSVAGAEIEADAEDVPAHMLNIISCDSCGKWAGKAKFTQEMQTAWETNPRAFIECEGCAVGARRKRVEYEFFNCTTCNRRWPEVAFCSGSQMAVKYKTETILTLQNSGKMDLATCATCAIAGTDFAERTETCVRCQRSMVLTGPCNDDCDGWAPTKIREFLQIGGGGIWL